jgi:L-alanine-DL-glutamate epimerase-like enolase superfamily enzyme
VYDSSFYFSDLEPEYAGRGIARILEEVDYSLAQGHRALKLKIGRGYQWMEREAGFRRDVEVVQAVRRHAGPDIRLMVDANNGYDLPTTRRFLEEAGIEFYWVEEMFPEDVELDLSLKAWIQHKGWRSLVADGESVGDLGRYAPFIEARALDVLQSNIKGWGLQQLQKLSQIAAPAGIGLAPNNWESFFGFYMEIVLGRGIPNLLMAEQDPGKTDLVDVSGFEFKEGRCRAPDLPGCGWHVPLDGLERGARLNWRVD